MWRHILAFASLITLGRRSLANPTNTSNVYIKDGSLPDGTLFSIRVPANWTGVLINDLDAITYVQYNTSRFWALLDQGYAFAGTARRADRDFQFDPRAERDNQVKVIDIFESQFGRAKHTIQYGCSGGGGVALGVADYPDKIDGAIFANGGEGIVMSNQRLDLLFTLKALLAPKSDLPLVGTSFEHRDEAAQAWNDTLRSARSTAQGRAKILLAGAISQMPMWGGAFAPFLEEPKLFQLDAVVEAMVRSVVDGAVYAAGVRYLYDNPAGVMSWNTGLDYRDFFRRADPRFKPWVKKLYRVARISLDDDLNTIEKYPRLAENSTATSHWKERALTGSIEVPVLQVSTIGDSSRTEALISAYEQVVFAKKRNPLYRKGLIRAAGHCTGNDAELVATVKAMIHRLEKGKWDNITKPKSLNAVGAGIVESMPRFMNVDVLPVENFRAYIL